MHDIEIATSFLNSLSRCIAIMGSNQLGAFLTVLICIAALACFFVKIYYKIKDKNKENLMIELRKALERNNTYLDLILNKHIY